MKAGGPLLDDRRLLHAVAARLCASGVAEEDVSWSEGCGPPADPQAFALETAFVICNSGMQNRIAAVIYRKVRAALLAGTPVRDAFGHPGKAAAIETIWRTRDELFAGYMEADDKVAFCRGIPWIGGITCYHLAKNFGAQVAKPDVHLQRLADRHGTDAQTLCEILAERTGFGVATIDLILWRACADGILDARTGALVVPKAQAPAPAPHQPGLFAPEQQELFA